MGCRPVTSMMQARQRLLRRMPLRASTRRKMWKSEALLFWTSFPCFILNLNFDAKSREQEKASLNSMIKCSMTSLYFSYDSKRTLATTVYVSHYHYKHCRLNVFPMHWFTFHQVFELPFSLEAILTFIHPRISQPKLCFQIYVSKRDNTKKKEAKCQKIVWNQSEVEVALNLPPLNHDTQSYYVRYVKIRIQATIVFLVFGRLVVV